MGTMHVPTGIRTSDTELAGRPAVLVEPTDGPDRAGTILYFHGGSYALGSPRTAMSLPAGLVVRTGVRSLSLDYRLAPERPFPAGIEDGCAAYRALLEQGVAAESVVLAGDSAGGGIAVSSCLLARDAGLPMPAGIVTFSGGLDQTRTGSSLQDKAGVDPMFTREALEASSYTYLAGADPHQPLASPAVHGDLTGFPPLLLQVGTNELLLDDTVRLADRAREADVDVILDVTAAVPHVFQSLAPVLDEAEQAFERAALFIRQRLA